MNPPPPPREIGELEAIIRASVERIKLVGLEVWRRETNLRHERENLRYDSETNFLEKFLTQMEMVERRLVITERSAQHHLFMATIERRFVQDRQNPN